jgi:ketosteroid isomerase-like protein
MSQQNLETVERLWEVWQRDGVGFVAEFMDPEVEWVNPSYAVEPGTRRGHLAFTAAADAVSSVYGGFEVLDPRLHEVGDRVAVTATVATRSHANGVRIVAQRGYVFDVRDGKVVRFAWFNSPGEALEALGLEPSDPPAKQ